MSSSSPSKLRRYSLDEIIYATNNFDESNLLRKGTDGGNIYFATVSYGKKMTQVTVKYLNSNTYDEFDVATNYMSKIQHPNLITTLGYCRESGKKILVREYMEKGSLYDYVKKESSVSLSWLTRIRICLDVARGLQRLHMATNEFPRGIIHRNVKPSKILLGKDWVAKISESGISKFSHAHYEQSNMLTHIKGTMGYYAPEYIKYRSVTRKIDVYAFGGVLFEVLCLKKPWDLGEEAYFMKEEDLGVWAQKNVDPNIIAQISDASLTEYTALIDATLKSVPTIRPTMDGVVLRLEKVLELELMGDDAERGRRAASRYRGSDQHSTAADMKKVLKLKEREREREPETEKERAAREELSRERYLRSWGKFAHISLDELRVATNNFGENNFLGKGGEAMVYRANIKIGLMLTEVAVKKLKPETTEFDTEITTMSDIKHNNILPLLGYCDQSGEKILIYEYMEKGSLSKYVRKRQPSSGPLSWLLRLRICLDAARGLQHLHVGTEKHRKGIIHRDIKPDNILLGKDWVAKISDFGMFKISKADQVESTMETDLKGTTGYFPLEYIRRRQVSNKTDVYCFGIVLFQVLCLTMPWDRGDETYIMTEEEDLGLYAAQNADPKIKANICGDSMKAYTSVIGKSLKEDPHKRPTMDDVVSQLEIALKCQELQDEKAK